MKIHSVKYNFIMNAILTVAGIIFPLITFPYISRVLLVEGSGKVAFATSVVTYFTMFASLGIPTYGVRACAIVRDNKEKLSKTVQELLIISGGTTLLTYIVFGISLFVIPEFAQERTLLLIVGLGIGLNTIGVQWLYNALEQYSYITTCSILFKVIGMILMFLLVKESSDYQIYGGVYVIASFGSYVLNFICLRKFVTFQKTGTYQFKQHLKHIMVFFAMSAGASIYLNLDVVMLRFLQSNEAIGYYNAGIKVKTVLVTCVTSLGTVLLPRLSYYIETADKKAFQLMVGKAFRFVFVAASAVTVYFSIFARESILLLSGEAFLPAVGPMMILMPTVLLIGLSNVTGIQILTPNGREREVMYSIWGGAILDFVLNLIVIPKFSANGAALSTLLAEGMVLLLQCWFLRDVLWSYIRQVQCWKIVIALAVASVMTIPVKIWIDSGVFVTLLVSAIVFFGGYAVVLLLLKEPFVSEILNSGIHAIVRKK
ncbi:flippase [[Ruminococcus] gnavus]|uniref:Flippase n=1 Tax=Mediterraneibacter gnavus TaxID=33038 RepID=A0AB35IX42_MEDGN|nr:flippase [Mediterraneibacter gnavus]MDB8724780.1 flippase [Mediterraneibacter gnavus]MDB8729210.1 flippase [Mediterraneibacter gnavus]MDB8731219.1 flippase [Mediterraneibacter gnavus]MDB8737350.1 flippase [Mediterraneibacter gnavus]